MDSIAHWLAAAINHPYDMWDAVGFFGAAVFGARFFIQWLKSEMEGRSVIPIAFWYCSLAGAMINLVYVIHLKSVPLVLGNADFFFNFDVFLCRRHSYFTIQPATP